MTKSTSPHRHVTGRYGTTYIEEADINVEVDVHVIDSSIFSTETQATHVSHREKGEHRD